MAKSDSIVKEPSNRLAPPINPIVEQDPADTLSWASHVLTFVEFAIQDGDGIDKNATDGACRVLRMVSDALEYEAKRVTVDQRVRP